MKVHDFARWILPEVLGCPDPVVDQAIVSTVYEFCDQTGAWDETQDAQTVEANVSDYDIPAPAGAIALRVLDVLLSGRPLSSLSFHTAAMTQRVSAPVGYTSSIERGVVRLVPVPTETGALLVVRAAYAPSMTATVLPDFLMQRYAEVIASGTKARLQMMPGVAWTNPTLAAVHAQRFQSGMIDARVESLYGRNNGSVRIEPKVFK
jgi:hypothetical protein